MPSTSLIAPQQVVQRTLAALERQVDEAAAAKPPALDLDLSAVQVIDSAGLAWLLSMLGRLQTLGIRFHLLNPSPILTDALVATRLDTRFTLLHTQAGADHGRG